VAVVPSVKPPLNQDILILAGDRRFICRIEINPESVGVKVLSEVFLVYVDAVAFELEVNEACDTHALPIKQFWPG